MNILRQYAVLTSGAQPWNNNICAANGLYFAYCATLAIYIYRLDESTHKYVLHSIMCEHKKTITAITFKKNAVNILASTCLNKVVIVWDICRQCVISKLENLNNEILSLEWCPFYNNTLAFVLEKKVLNLWDYSSIVNNVTIYDTPKFSHSISTFKWNGLNSNKLCFGHVNGSLSFLCSGKKSAKHVLPTVNFETSYESDPVIDMDWDPLSTEYILVSTKQSGIRLIDSDSHTIIMKYKLPSSITIRKFCWIPLCPGMFISCDSGSGVLRIWTVSKDTQIKSIKIKENGFNSMCVIDTCFQQKTKLSNDKISNSSSSEEGFQIPPAQVVSVFVDGGVGVYNIKRNCWDFFRDLGHVETIFDCQFHPEDPDVIATSSFDGSIKIWNINQMKAIHVLPGNYGIIYNLSWGTGDLNFICAATAKHGLILWDIKRNIVAKVFDEHKDGAVFSCSWNKQDSRFIASCGADKNCIVRMVDGSSVKIYEHPQQVFGCDWCPKNRDLLATACEDGLVRIFYIPTDSVLKVFHGHTAKVFNVKWSPIKDGVLCSGSDDKTIRVWDYSLGECIQCLEGHSGPVRGLLWNPEISNMIISGSWDFSIKVWDVRTGYCIYTTSDHAADVYGLACHPQQPFIIASTSRDSTLRLWHLQSTAQPIYAIFLADHEVDSVLSCHAEKSKHPHSIEILSGNIMKLIKSSKSKTFAQKLQLYAHCFLPPINLRNFWLLISVIKDGRKAVLPSTYNEGIMHALHLVKYKAAEAQELEMAKSNFSKGIASKKKKEMLLKAANIYISIGQLEKYCEIMVELNQWERALSVAPGVSIEYWQFLMQRYNEVLFTREDEDLKVFSMASNDIVKLCSFYREVTKQYQDALLAVQVELESERLPYHNKVQNSFQDNDLPKNNDIFFQRNEMKILQATISHELSSLYMNNGDPIGAASSYLSVNNVDSACVSLLQGNELELAFSLAKVLPVSKIIYQEVLITLSRRCEKHNLWDLSIKWLKEIGNDELFKACARFPGNNTQRNELLLKAGLPNLQECQSVYESKADKDLLDIFPYMIVAETKHESIQNVLLQLKACMNTSTWNLDKVLPYMQVIWNIRTDIVLVMDTKLRDQILGVSAYIGALQAIQRSFQTIVFFLFQHASKLLQNDEENNNALLKIIGEDCESLGLNKINPNELRENNLQLQTITQKKIYSKLSNKFDKVLSGEYKVVGEQLPSHNTTFVNMFTNERIKGPLFVLEDGVSMLPLSTALMWAVVNPYSPLATGHKINPF
ncbi:WD repeat-containing protein 17 isoform X1 [Hydra vulgaris]|uniref:WD repeat-containing protein 17 isoform X1 n=1 Tax=Hydra vulgaris TaxID=6087 RepID=UPI001F5E79E5|nr:WD repeat-containing protein 17 isoform X1 [Hydra vulgaris]